MDPIDRILVSDDRLAPSPGFHSRVMDAVVAEETKSPPLPFPWGRFTAGVAGCAVWAVSGAVVADRIDWSVFAPVVSALTLSPRFPYALAVVCGSLLVVAIPRFRNVG
jgi:hypothetical protein